MTLTIVAVSLEERSRALVEALHEKAATENEVLLLEFAGYENVGPYLYNRMWILHELHEKGFEPKKVEVDLNRPLESMSRLGTALSQISPDDVILDVSVLPRNYLFGLCRLLASSGLSTLIRYYRPKEYGTQLSRGIGTVRSIPGFEGEMNSSGDIFLAIVLGFEGYKALHAWERIGPTTCIALVGDPPHQAEYLDCSRKHNEELLKTVEGIQVEKLHTYDVKEAVSQLKIIYENSKISSHDNSFIVCPLGTKLQSLACFVLANCNPEVTVANVDSLTYYSETYSKGVNPSYIELSLQEILSCGPLPGAWTT